MRAPASHETRRLNGTTHRLIGNVTGVSMADIEAGLNANGAGLGDYSVEISVNVRTGVAHGSASTKTTAKTSTMSSNSLLLNTQSSKLKSEALALLSDLPAK